MLKSQSDDPHPGNSVQLHEDSKGAELDRVLHLLAIGLDTTSEETCTLRTPNNNKNQNGNSIHGEVEVGVGVCFSCHPA